MIIVFSGEFGIVHKATLSGWNGNNQDVVAAKTLKGESMSGAVESVR